jgi:hypothetical protein
MKALRSWRTALVAVGLSLAAPLWLAAHEPSAGPTVETVGGFTYLTLTERMPDWYRREFGLPPDRSRTLRLTSEGSGFAFLSVAGVPVASYVVETPSNLTWWTAVHTNVGAPFTHSLPFAADGPVRFYRATVWPGRTSDS